MNLNGVEAILSLSQCLKTKEENQDSMADTMLSSSSSECNGLSNTSYNHGHHNDQASEILPRFFIPGINGRARCLMNSEGENGSESSIPSRANSMRAYRSAATDKCSVSHFLHRSLGSLHLPQETSMNPNPNANENPNADENPNAISHPDGRERDCETPLQLLLEKDEKKKRRKKHTHVRRERRQPSKSKGHGRRQLSPHHTKRKKKPSVSNNPSRFEDPAYPASLSKLDAIDPGIVDRLSIALSKYASVAGYDHSEKESSAGSPLDSGAILESPPNCGTRKPSLIEMLQVRDTTANHRNNSMTLHRFLDPELCLPDDKDTRTFAAGNFDTSLSFIEQDRSERKSTDASDAYSLAKALHDSILQRHTQTPRNYKPSPRVSRSNEALPPLSDDLDAQDILAVSSSSPKAIKQMSSLLFSCDSSCSAETEEISAHPVTNVMSSSVASIDPMELLYTSMTSTVGGWPKEDYDINERLCSSAPLHISASLMKEERKVRKHASELPSIPDLSAIRGHDKRRHKRSSRQHQKPADVSQAFRAIQSSHGKGKIIASDVGYAFESSEGRNHHRHHHRTLSD